MMLIIMVFTSIGVGLRKIRPQSRSIIVLVSWKCNCFHCEYELMKLCRLALEILALREESVGRKAGLGRRTGHGIVNQSMTQHMGPFAIFIVFS